MLSSNHPLLSKKGSLMSKPKSHDAPIIEVVSHPADLDSCIDRLTKGLADGSLFTDFVKDPLDVLGCLAIVIGSLMHSAADSDDTAPVVFANEKPISEEKVVALAEALKINVTSFTHTPSGELVTGAGGALIPIIKVLAPIVLPQLANIAKQLIYQWLEKNRPTPPVTITN